MTAKTLNVKRFLVVAIAAMLMGGLLVGPAASAPGSSKDDSHPHLHITGLELDENEEPLGWRKCKPLANGQQVPVEAHHSHLHTGRAGEAQWQAGNAVVPAIEGVTPWTNCAELAAFFFGE